MAEEHIKEAVLEAINQTPRPATGFLHASQDILDSLRHVQLRYVGAPASGREGVSPLGWTRAITGTLWHDYLGRRFEEQGRIVLREINLQRFMPEGWSGTADFLLWDKHKQMFHLLDLKTTTDRSMPYVPKTEHIYQVSAYWHAVKRMGLPLIAKPKLIYVPLDSNHSRRDTGTDLLVHPFDPLSTVENIMADRYNECMRYAEELQKTGDYANKLLAPTQERVQRAYLNRRAGTIELKWTPHWSTAYCPYDTSLCDCSEQTTNKIGQWSAHSLPTAANIKYSPGKGGTEVHSTAVEEAVEKYHQA